MVVTLCNSSPNRHNDVTTYFLLFRDCSPSHKLENIGHRQQNLKVTQIFRHGDWSFSLNPSRSSSNASSTSGMTLKRLLSIYRWGDNPNKQGGCDSQLPWPYTSLDQSICLCYHPFPQKLLSCPSQLHNLWRMSDQTREEDKIACAMSSFTATNHVAFESPLKSLVRP